MNRYVSLFVAIVCTSCVPASRPLTQNTTSSRAIIVVPGFKGSLLADKDQEIVWIKAHEAIFGDRSLTLAAPGVRPEVDVHPTVLLRSLNLVGAIGQNFYGVFLNKLHRRCRDTQIIEFAYDWRRSAVQTAQELDSVVKRLRSRGITSIDIVAHSFGGLALSWYLRYGPQSEDSATDRWTDTTAIKSIVLAGVPFRGAYQILHDLKFGSTQGLNTRILDQEALSTFASSFELLPFGDQRERSPIYALDFWQRERVGLFAKGDTSESKNAYIRDLLQKAVTFKLKLVGDSGVRVAPADETKVLVVLGNQENTPSIESASRGSFDADTRDVGDDTVPVGSAVPPEAFFDRFPHMSSIRTSLPHYRMLDDDRIIDFVCGRTEPPQ